jgi:murein DD-endopeptidase MepM/ murein hydrolase activator NlpD
VAVRDRCADLQRLRRPGRLLVLLIEPPGRRLRARRRVAPIQAIADGVVREVIVGGPFGVHVVIDHEVNGEKVSSVYAHMQWGSPTVAAGQAVTVGQYLGDVGSTGASTGPHLHLEIHVDEKPVDPFVWLKANAN